MPQKKILLIAGHGDGDSGAVGNGFKECDLTRELLALLLKEGNKKGLDVSAYPSELNCYKETKRWGTPPPYVLYDYVFEIHFNAFSGQANGTEIIISEQEKGYSVETKILENICSLGFKSRGVKRHNDLLNMNNCVKKGVSYALLETCFISSPEDMLLYHLEKYRIAEAIINGIIDGFGIKVNTETTSNNTNIQPKIQVGTKVKIIGNKYATGQNIPSWVKDKTHTIQQIKNDRVLLKEIFSWVLIKDIKGL